jgi:hypothetical protein
MTTKPTRSRRRPPLAARAAAEPQQLEALPPLPPQTAPQPHLAGDEAGPSAEGSPPPEAEARNQFVEDGLHVAEQLRGAADAACEAAEQLHRAMGEARQVAAEARVAINDQRRLLTEMRETLSEYERLLQGYVN